MSKTIRARAPLRISFGGGGTDVAPFSEERGGQVLNTTINRYAYTTLIPRETETVTLQSLDYAEEVAFSLQDGVPAFDGQMDLAKGVIRRVGRANIPTGFELFTHTECPPGSGLGSSSTVVVSLIGAFDRWLQLGLDRYEIARMAFEIERRDVGIQGGKQDQYAATFGGFNFIEFDPDRVLVNPLRLPPEWVSELEYSLVLAYTGQSRYSSDIIEKQIDNYEHGRSKPVEAMQRTKELAVEMKRTLLKGRLEAFGHLLHEAWQVKKQMSDKITTPFIDELYEAAYEAGALGGKISGAGGGGFMFCLTRFDRRHHVIDALKEHGAEVVHFGFTDAGMQTWIP